MIAVWGIRSTPTLLSLPDSLWLGVVSSDRVLSMGQIELNCNYVQVNYFKFTVFTMKLCVFKKLCKLNYLK